MYARSRFSFLKSTRSKSLCLRRNIPDLAVSDRREFHHQLFHVEAEHAAVTRKRQTIFFSIPSRHSSAPNKDQ